MGFELVVADAELMRLARQVEDVAATLAACGEQLAALVRELYETKAIDSAATRSALERDAKAIARLASATTRAVANVASGTSGYVGALDELDDLVS